MGLDLKFGAKETILGTMVKILVYERIKEVSCILSLGLMVLASKAVSIKVCSKAIIA